MSLSRAEAAALGRRDAAPRKEADVLKSILAYLRTRRDVVAWRVNSGSVVGEYKGKRRFVRFNSMPGMSDIAGWRSEMCPACLRPPAPYRPADPAWDAAHPCNRCQNTGRWSRPLYVEVKAPGKKPTQEQQSFLDLVKAHGGIAFCARSVDDVVKELGQ